MPYSPPAQTSSLSSENGADASNNVFVVAEKATLAVSESASYTAVISDAQLLVRKTLSYDYIYDYYMNDADSAACLNLFTVSNVFPAPSGASSTTPQNGTVAFSTAGPALAMIKDIMEAFKSDVGATKGMVSNLKDDLNSWLLETLNTDFDANHDALFNDIPNLFYNDVALTLGTSSGVVEISNDQLNAAVNGVAVKLSDNSLANQIDPFHLSSYAAAGGVNYLKTNALPCLKGDTLSFGVLTNNGNVSLGNAAVGAIPAIAYDATGGGAPSAGGSNNLSAVVVLDTKDAVDAGGNKIAPGNMAFAFRIHLGCAASGTTSSAAGTGAFSVAADGATPAAGELKGHVPPSAAANVAPPIA